MQGLLAVSREWGRICNWYIFPQTSQQQCRQQTSFDRCLLKAPGGTNPVPGTVVTKREAERGGHFKAEARLREGGGTDRSDVSHQEGNLLAGAAEKGQSSGGDKMSPDQDTQRWQQGQARRRGQEGTETVWTDLSMPSRVILRFFGLKTCFSW